MSQIDVTAPRQWDLWALLPVVAGLYWLLGDSSSGWLWWGLLPACLMLSTGMGLLLWPGDSRLPQFLAAGGLIGTLFALPGIFVGGFWDALVVAALSAGSFLVAGATAMRALPGAKGMPAPRQDWQSYAKLALDDALLAYFRGTAVLPSGDQAQGACDEVLRTLELAVDQGWAKQPQQLHNAPGVPSRQSVTQRRVYGRDYEHLQFRSEFVADPGIPGAARWTGFHGNDQCHAWVLRHSGRPRPWLMGIHGYRMGVPWLDFSLFDPRWLHDRMGFNLILPVLPLHGLRRHGWRSGDSYLDGEFMDVFHAQTQALWDLRRTLAWLRQQEDQPQIGVMGFSLGGYNAALLAQYEEALDFVIAGIPLTDVASALWANIPQAHQGYYEARGVGEAQLRQMLQPVSPLARKPLQDKDRRFIFAGNLDRLIPPPEVMKLAAHWEVEPRWFHGAHLTFRGAKAVSSSVSDAAAAAGWPAASS